jgi:hypothetical protein
MTLPQSIFTGTQIFQQDGTDSRFLQFEAIDTELQTAV